MKKGNKGQARTKPFNQNQKNKRKKKSKEEGA
jgi:hypothetical protein